MLLNFSSLTISLFITALSLKVQAMWLQFELTRFDNSEDGLVKTDVRVTRLNKTAQSMKGTVKYMSDLSNDYDVEAKLFYSAKGNNQFVLTPYKFPRAPICFHMDNVYKKVIAPYLDEEITDFPKAIENQPMCPMHKKGIYHLYGYIPDSSAIPKMFNVGVYRAEATIYKANSSDISSRMSCYFRLY